MNDYMQAVSDHNYFRDVSNKHYKKTNKFFEGLAIVQDEQGLYGFINERGYEVIPCWFLEANDFSEGFALVKFLRLGDDDIGFIDKSGNVLKCDRQYYNYAKDFSEGLAAVAYAYDPDNFSKGYRYQYINNKGNVGIDLRIHGVCDIFSFSEGLAQIVINPDKNSNYHKRGYTDKHGYINKRGEIAINFKYDDSEPFENGKAKVSKNGKVGYIDKVGNEIIPIKYDIIKTYINGILIVSKDKKWGAIHEAGVEIIPCESASEEELFSKELTKLNLRNLDDKRINNYIKAIKKSFVVANNVTTHSEEIELWGLGYWQTSVCIPCVFNFIDTYSTVYRVLLNGKWGFMNDLGNLVVPCQYEDAEKFGEEETRKGIPLLAKVKKNNKWGYIDKMGNEIIPCIYDELGKFNNDLCCFYIGEKVGYIDSTGKLILPPIYNKSEIKQIVNRPKGYFIIIEKNKRFGIIHNSGKEIVPTIYTSINVLGATGNLLARLSNWEKRKEYSVDYDGVILDYKSKSTPRHKRKYEEAEEDYLDDYYNDDALDAFEGDSDAYWIWQNG